MKLHDAAQLADLHRIAAELSARAGRRVTLAEALAELLRAWREGQ